MLQSSDYDETAKFCSMFDWFFNCLNTRNASEGKKKRKPDLDSYRSVEDKQLEVSVVSLSRLSTDRTLQYCQLAVMYQ